MCKQTIKTKILMFLDNKIILNKKMCKIYKMREKDLLVQDKTRKYKMNKMIIKMTIVKI